MIQSQQQSRKLLYLLDLFPKLSETFVTNEIKSVINNNIPTSIWACRPSTDKLVHVDAKELLPYTTYFLREPPSKSEKLKAAIFLLSKNPARFIAAHRIFKKFNSPPSNYQLRNHYVFAGHCLASGITHIHTHFAKKAAEHAMFISVLSGIPFSVTCHAFDIFLPNPPLSDILHRSKFIVTISEYNKKYIAKKHSGLITPVHVIHCGIDPGKTQVNIKTEKFSTKRKIKIFSVGRLVEKKGMSYLIEGCKRLLDEGFMLECEIAGDGPLQEELELQIKNSRIEGAVRLLGSIAPEDVWSRLSACDIFALPAVVAQDGDMDGIPVALMEAVAVGKPVVATRVSGLPELLEGVGWLCNEKEPDEIARAVQQIVNEDEVLIGNRMKLGVERIRNDFNQQLEAEKLVDVFSLSH